MSCVLELNLCVSSAQNREERLRKKKQIGHVSKVRPSARRNVANLTDLRQTNFKWQKGRKLGKKNSDGVQKGG